MPKQKKDTDERPESPLNLPDVGGSRDMSTNREDDTSEDSYGDVSEGQHDDESTETSKLKQHLELVIDQPASMRSEKPDLSVKPNGYVSEEVDEMLRGVVNALENRYGKNFSKSLVMDFALRAVLLDAHREGETSQLVQWLDAVLGEDR
jgi:hypothetical protein